MLYQQARGVGILVFSLREPRNSFFWCLFSGQPGMFQASWTLRPACSVDHTWLCSQNGLPCMQSLSHFGQPGSGLRSTSLTLSSVMACQCICAGFKIQQPRLWTHCPFLRQICCSMSSPWFWSRDNRAALTLVAPCRPAQACIFFMLHPTSSPWALNPFCSLCWGSVQKPSRAGPSRLATVWGLLSSLGATSLVLCLAEHVHCLGTQGVCSAHWDSWVRWCADHSALPHNPSRFDVANFWPFCPLTMAFLVPWFECTRPLSALPTQQLGGPSFSDDLFLRDLVRSAALLEAKSPCRNWSWDLFLVLSALRVHLTSPLGNVPWSSLLLRQPYRSPLPLEGGVGMSLAAPWQGCVRARWVREMIKAAYCKTLVRSVFVSSPPVIRAWASFLAFASFCLSQLLDWVYWRSPGMFIHYYWRDMSCLKEEGSRDIASAVVAQQLLLASCAPSFSLFQMLNRQALLPSSAVLHLWAMV